jgi:hypothetical protein
MMGEEVNAGEVGQTSVKPYRTTPGGRQMVTQVSLPRIPRDYPITPRHPPSPSMAQTQDVVASFAMPAQPHANPVMISTFGTMYGCCV